MPQKHSPEDCNLDCFVNPDELDEWRDDKELPLEVRAYAWTKQRAMQYRMAGQVVAALEEERACELIYLNMPREWRW